MSAGASNSNLEPEGEELDQILQDEQEEDDDEDDDQEEEDDDENDSNELDENGQK